MWSYKTSCISSGMHLKTENLSPADFIFTSFHNEDQWLDWGLVYDNSIHVVSSNSEPGKLVSLFDNCRLYFKIGTGTPVPPIHQFEYK